MHWGYALLDTLRNGVTTREWHRVQAVQNMTVDGRPIVEFHCLCGRRIRAYGVETAPTRPSDVLHCAECESGEITPPETRP